MTVTNVHWSLILRPTPQYSEYRAVRISDPAASLEGLWKITENLKRYRQFQTENWTRDLLNTKQERYALDRGVRSEQDKIIVSWAATPCSLV
jgi:hypothetical protein